MFYHLALNTTNYHDNHSQFIEILSQEEPATATTDLAVEKPKGPDVCQLIHSRIKEHQQQMTQGFWKVKTQASSFTLLHAVDPKQRFRLWLGLIVLGALTHAHNNITKAG